jgi:hypothetical protein
MADVVCVCVFGFFPYLDYFLGWDTTTEFLYQVK